MASTTFSGPVTSTNGFIGALTGNVAGSGAVTHASTAAINASATATAAEVATGYITSTSAGCHYHHFAYRHFVGSRFRRYSRYCV
jgi:ADP-ribosylglycohydrolase